MYFINKVFNSIFFLENDFFNVKKLSPSILNHVLQTFVRFYIIHSKETTKWYSISQSKNYNYSHFLVNVLVNFLVNLLTFNELFSKCFLYWLVVYLTPRKRSVQIDDKRSKELYYTNFGVPQSSILETVLFNLYVSDIKKNTAQFN